ncbi:MAG: hypothetical protein IJ153_01510 [Clostridia bacterium]|nr:hypothetical protein [Clostridia bacterium]
MKKLLLAILTATIIFAIGCATAEEEFTFRNGIKFGMSKAEVESIEANNSAIRISDAHSENYAPIHLVVYTDSIEGFSPYNFVKGENGIATIDYCFSSDDKLFRVIYHLDSTCELDDYDAGNKVLSQFNDVADLLGRRYKLIAEGKNQNSLIKFGSPAPSYLSLVTSRDWQLSGIDKELEEFKQYLLYNDNSYVDVYLYIASSKKWEGIEVKKTLPTNICIEITSITDTLAGKYLTDKNSNDSNRNTEANQNFNALTVDSFAISNSKWTEDDVSRALLVAGLISDAKDIGNCPYDEILSSGSFVLGCNGPIIMLYAYHSAYDEILSIMYANTVDVSIPDGKENAVWSISEGKKEYNSLYATKLLDELGFESIYDIPKANLDSALSLLGVK